MSALLIPASYGPMPVREIIVDECEGTVNLDLSRVVEDEDRYIQLTPDEARAVACALGHFADKADPRRCQS